jgi:hypothetical protein
MTTPPRTPTCCELACYEDPGCTCDGCHPDPAPLDVEPACVRCGKKADGQRAEAWYCTRCAGVARRHAKEPLP